MKNRSSRIVMLSLVLATAATSAFGQWKDAGTIEVLATTQNNNDREYDDEFCANKSPDGKYCADLVVVTVKLPDIPDIDYRFKNWGQDSCPSFSIVSGPKGWYRVDGCEMSTDLKEFTGRVLAWTHPQRFRFTLMVEYKM